VYVAVPVASWLVIVPSEPSDGQAVGTDVVGVVPETVVVVYWHGCQFTLVLVAPLTVATKVVDWPRMRTEPTEEVTETVTTLALLLPPHPATQKENNVAASAIPLALLRNLIPPASQAATAIAVEVVLRQPVLRKADGHTLSNLLPAIKMSCPP
jgi:hypothetical protein